MRRSLAFEHHSIEYIPAAERHGRSASLFPFWFVSNVQITVVAIGAIIPTLGLDLLWSIIALLVGNLIGAVFMAYHSAQGPELGIPQMIQSRAQFGMYGAILPLIVVIFMYLSFFISSAILGGEALSAWFHVARGVGIVLEGAVALMLTWWGYTLFHALAKPLAVLSGPLFVYLTIKVWGHLPAHHHAAGNAVGDILLAVSIAATGQITWAPYVSDYSRYLPVDTSPRKIFLYTYSGTVIGSAWMQILGSMTIIVSADAFTNGPAYYAIFLPGGKWLVYLILVAGVTVANMENLYGTFLSALTGLSPSGKPFLSVALLRVVITSVAGVVGTAFAILASEHLLTNLESLLLLMLYFMVPWTAINLTDYYIVRRGRYSIRDIFDVQGVYGAANWVSLGIFAATILVEVPFMNTPLYVGPIARRLGGADIAWVVGLAVAAAAYYAATRLRPVAFARRTSGEEAKA